MALADFGAAAQKVMHMDYEVVRNYEKELKFHPLPEFYQKYAGNRYDAFLLGMSHSYGGFLERISPKRIYKFSVPSMDLYYQLKLLTDLKEKYDFSKVETIIFELPYYIFNYDISMTKETFLKRINYYYYFEDYHHFGRDREQQSQIKLFEELNRSSEASLYGRAKDDKITAEKKNPKFPGIEKMYYKCRYLIHRKEKHIWMEEERQDILQMRPHVWYKEHPDTIQENKHIWKQILKTIKEIGNLNVKIMVFPFCPYFIEGHQTAIKKMKELFYENIGIEPEDVFDCFELFMDKPEYFADECHLNEKGKYIFTRKCGEWMKNV